MPGLSVELVPNMVSQVLACQSSSGAIGGGMSVAVGGGGKSHAELVCVKGMLNALCNICNCQFGIA